MHPLRVVERRFADIRSTTGAHADGGRWSWAGHSVATVALALLVCLLFAATSDADSSHIYRVPGGGKLIVPSTSITNGARVVIRRAKGPAVQPSLRAMGRPVSLRMRGGRLVGPARLVLPLRGRIKRYGMPLDRTVRMAYFNATKRRWETVPAKINPRRRTISAWITHFSWWNPLSWDWDSLILRLDQRIGELRGGRTGPAKCISGIPVPDWANTVTDNGADIQLRTCAEGQDGKVVVQIVNNRPFGLVLSYGAPVVWGWHQTPSAAANALGALMMDDLVGANELYLPPLQAASVGVARGDWWFAQFQAQITPASTFADILALAADEIDMRWVRKEFVGPLIAKCSAQIKGTLGGIPTVKKDALGWLGTASNCLLKALPAAAKAVKLDGLSIDRIQHSLEVLSGIGRGAKYGKLTGQIADWIVARPADMQGNMSFSIRRKADSSTSGGTGTGTGGTGGTGGGGGASATRQIAVDNRVTNGAAQMRQDTPAYLSTVTRNFCKRDGCALLGTDVGSGAVLTAECTVLGDRTTNGQDNSTIDDGNPGLYSSTRWYGIRWGDGRFGYISEVWIAAQYRGGLGLRAC